MADEKKTDPPEPTPRMVLKRERVWILPDGLELDDAQRKAIAEVVKAASKGATGRHGHAWVELGPVEDGSKTRAIERYAGKAGTPDAKPGTYRAPSMRAWKGGASYERPAKPLVDRQLFDD